MLALWLTDVDPATRARMLACMLERANEGDCTVLSDASRVSRPEELERFNLWPLTTDRLRPWLTHPQRAVRETGLRLVGYLQTAAPREQEPAREPGPEAAPPPRKRPRPRR